MKHLLYLICVLLIGCGTVPRRQTPAISERVYEFHVKHNLPRERAFLDVESALAHQFNDLPQVMKLRQPETGKLVLKPLLDYKMGDIGGPFFSLMYLRYTLSIDVSQIDVKILIELGPHEPDGTWPPIADMPKVKARIHEVASRLAFGINGAVLP